MKKLALLFTFYIAFCDAQAQEIGFVCGPCGCAEDETFHSEPGNCASCGMERFATYKAGYSAEMRHSTEDRKTVAIFIFPGVQIIDYTGPYEVFGQAGWNVFTVAESDSLLQTAMGMQVKPHYTFENAPQADFLLLPGGGVDQHLDNEKVMSWIKREVALKEQTLSVCNGAYFLGAAGLLDGKTATTFAPLITGLQQIAPEANVVSDARFTDNGKILTSAGLSSGIDAAIYLVSKYQGVGSAQRLATHLEYDWNPDRGYVRAQLPDLHLRGFSNFVGQYDPRLLRYEGDASYWVVEMELTTELTVSELIRVFAFQAEEGLGWKATGTGAWEYERDNKRWKGSLQVRSQDEGKWIAFKVQKRTDSKSE